MNIIRNIVFAYVIAYAAIANAALTEKSVQRNVVCGTPLEIAEVLTKYKEKIALRGSSSTTIGEDKAQMFLFVNPDTGSYSIVLGASTTICVLETGVLTRQSPTATL